MKTIHAMRATLITTVLALVAWPATSGWAQGALAPQTSSQSPGGAPPAGGMTAVAVAVSVVAVSLKKRGLGKMLDPKRKPEGEALARQARSCDAAPRVPTPFSR